MSPHSPCLFYTVIVHLLLFNHLKQAGKMRNDFDSYVGDATDKINMRLYWPSYLLHKRLTSEKLKMANDVIREQMQRDCCSLVPSLYLLSSATFFSRGKKSLFRSVFRVSETISRNFKQQKQPDIPSVTWKSPETGQNNVIASVTVSIVAQR